MGAKRAVRQCGVDHVVCVCVSVCVLQYGDSGSPDHGQPEVL